MRNRKNYTGFLISVMIVCSIGTLVLAFLLGQ